MVIGGGLVSKQRAENEFKSIDTTHEFEVGYSAVNQRGETR
jgi:hypothetical protein